MQSTFENLGFMPSHLFFVLLKTVLVSGATLSGTFDRSFLVAAFFCNPSTSSETSSRRSTMSLSRLPKCASARTRHNREFSLTLHTLTHVPTTHTNALHKHTHTHTYTHTTTTTTTTTHTHRLTHYTSTQTRILPHNLNALHTRTRILHTHTHTHTSAPLGSRAHVWILWLENCAWARRHSSGSVLDPGMQHAPLSE